MSKCYLCNKNSIGCLVFWAIIDGSFLGSAEHVCKDHKNQPHPYGGKVTFTEGYWPMKPISNKEHEIMVKYEENNSNN